MSASPLSRRLAMMLRLAIGLLAAEVLVSIVAGYRLYLPPDFADGFLVGRRRYFFDGYHLAFYTHIAAGPITLVTGAVLMSTRFLRRLPRAHRGLGRLQVALVVGLLVPSGWIMAQRAAAGPAATLGFEILSVLTAATALAGVVTAVRRRFASHRRWMTRCYLLLCSTLVLRVLGGLGTVLAVSASWYDPLIGWLSWLMPLAVYETRLRLRGWRRRTSADVWPGTPL